MAKTLIAFFSRADENYFGGAMRYVKNGLAITGSQAANAKAAVEKWFAANGLM